MAKNNNMMIIGGIVIVVIVIIAAALLLTGSSGPAPVTTTVATTVIPTTVASSTTTAPATIVSTISNYTTLVGPNLATCNGYNVSVNKTYATSDGTCGWRASAGQNYLSIGVYGGGYNNVEVTLLQENATSTPFTFNFAGTNCTSTTSNSTFVPTGNYKVSFYVGGAIIGSKCGPATMRISH